MTAANYPACLAITLDFEGGYSNDAGDPGGPTKYGITCYDLAEHRHQKMTSMAAWASIVRAMPLSEAEDIYATKYATAVQFDLLNAGPDCAIFDFQVNSGNWGVKFAQRVAGVTQDGILGEISLAAINAINPTTFVNELCDARLAFMRRISTWPRFGAGWSSRVADLRSYCKTLTAQKPMALLDAPESESFCEKPTIVHPLAFAKAAS